MIRLNLDGTYVKGVNDSVTELETLNAVLGALRKKVNSDPDAFLDGVAKILTGCGRPYKSLTITSKLNGNTLIHEFKLE